MWLLFMEKEKSKRVLGFIYTLPVHSNYLHTRRELHSQLNMVFDTD